jgi:hypothetical protein
MLNTRGLCVVVRFPSKWVNASVLMEQTPSGGGNDPREVSQTA